MSTDELEVLAMKADALGQEIRLAAEDSPILVHAANTISLAAAGIRKAIVKAEAAAQRREVHVERRLADAQERTYDELTKQLAKQRGISYEEMQKIRDDAAVRSRQAAGRGSISEQLAGLAKEGTDA